MAEMDSECGAARMLPLFKPGLCRVGGLPQIGPKSDLTPIFRDTRCFLLQTHPLTVD